VVDDGEKKLPTSEELPTSADNDGGKQEEKPETVIVDYNGWIEVHHRLPDGTLGKGHDFTDAELVPEEAQDEGDEFSDDEFGVEWHPHAADENSQRAERIKTIDIETLLAAQDILEADNRPISQEANLNRAEIEKPRQHSKSGDFELRFYKSDLDDYTAQRKIGLSSKSIDWIARASLALWESTKGEITPGTVTALRENTLAKYASAYSHSKVLSFAKGFLTFLARTNMEPRYTSFEAYLEMPKAVKERKSVFDPFFFLKPTYICCLAHVRCDN